MNGKPGDHPHTDVVVYGLPVFTPEIDALIKELEGPGGWESTLARHWLLDVHGELWRLGDGYRDLTPDERESQRSTPLHNLRFLLQYELNRLQAKPPGE